MVSQANKEHSILVRIVIERYEDRVKGQTSVDEIHRGVVAWADKLIKERPEGSLVNAATGFVMVASCGYDRYEEDERHMDDEARRAGSFVAPADFGDEDRYCVELKYLARFVVGGSSMEEACERLAGTMEDLFMDCHGDSLEEYATNSAWFFINENE